MDYAHARKDLLKADVARKNGLEGQSRVLARLAAASALRTYLAQKKAAPAQSPLIRVNAYELISQFARSGSFPSRIQAALGHLVQKVDESYRLPEGVDLLAEAGLLINYFENNNNLQE